VNKTKNQKFYIILPVLLAIALAVGILTGATMADPKTGKTNFISSLVKFKEILTYVERDYVDEVDAEKLVGEAINEMLEKLDPHSVYIPAKDRELTNSQLEGEFDGIGIEFNIIKDTIYVITPLEGGPSEAVGLLSGDKILKVDGETVAGIGITNRDVFDLLRGPKGTEVEVGIKRRSEVEVIHFIITRDKIPQHSVPASYMIQDEIGYIKVSRFAATTYDEFYTALTDLQDQGMKKLILDLQNNPGGYMDRAIKMADEFISGSKMIVYTDGKQDRYDSEARARKNGVFEEGALIVLINEGSASASEIVSGAIQDNDRGLIVGRRSFGKGLVQNQIPLSDGSELRLTISRYYIPSGRSIQRPYEGKSLDYYEDYITRNTNGELFHQDSIKVNDSLSYTTSKGRVVYGGGGIIPDQFVPIDTSMNSNYLRKILYNSVYREYPLSYYQKNKNKLKKMDYQDYFDNFEVSDDMLQDFAKMAVGNGIDLDPDGLESSKDLLKTYMKAEIAKLVWDSKGFYPIFNQQNEILQAALDLFDEAESLAEYSQNPIER
jgi:carboxyl-terminal processing protease